MRRFLFLLLGFAHFGPLQAQELTGKWNGYFIPNNNQESQIYIYNVEIEENDNHELSSLLQQIELLKSFNEELKKDKERLYEQVEFYQRLLPTQQNQDIQTPQQTDNDTIEQDYSFIDETLTQRFFRKLFWK